MQTRTTSLPNDRYKLATLLLDILCTDMRGNSYSIKAGSVITVDARGKFGRFENKLFNISSWEYKPLVLAA